MTISGRGFGDKHESGIVTNKPHLNKDNIQTENVRVNNLINGAINKRGVCCFVGREVKGIKGKKRSFMDKNVDVYLHPLKLNFDDILSFGKDITGVASMMLPFLLAEHNGVHHRVRGDPKKVGDAVILPNIPTVCITDENGRVTGCTAVGTHKPLPTIISYLNKDDGISFVKDDSAGLPVHSVKKADIREEEEEYET